MISDAQWEVIGGKIMQLPGMITDRDSDFIAENAEADMSYIKFMSDGGVTDNHNGSILFAYMQSQGCTVTSNRPRSMKINDSDLLKLFA